MAETAPGSLLFTNSAASVTLLNDVLGEFGVQEWISASITIPALGITNAVYPCTEPPPYYSLFFDNDLYGVVLAIGAAPPGTPRPAVLNIRNEYYSEYEALTETAAGSGVFTNASHSARLLQIANQPRLAVSDSVFLTNTIFSVWETAPQSGEYRNYNAPILTDMSPDDLAMTDFTPWRLRITGASNTSLVEEVSIVTSVDSTNQITFTYVNGDLLSDQKFILIPDGPLAAPPPAGYVPIRLDVTSPRTRSTSPLNVAAFLTLKGCSPMRNDKLGEKDAIVWRSLGWPDNSGVNEDKKIVTQLKAMKYNVELRTTATRQWVLDNIKKKSVWYSMCHGHPELQLGSLTKIVFAGLKFEGGAILRQSDIEGLGLDYKLVIVDACCSAMTVPLDEFEVRLGDTAPATPKRKDAQNANKLLDECAAFASAFGSNAAYVGWAWTMRAKTAQNLTSEFLNNLKGGKTVQEAYDQFLLGPDDDRKLMKIHGAINNVIDKTAKGDTQ